MFLILLVLVLIGMGYVFHYIESKNSWDSAWGFLSIMCFVFGGIGLSIALVLIPLKRNSVYLYMAEHEAIRHTVEITREMGEPTELERIKLTESIIDTNVKLASAKYYANHNWFKIYFPEEVLDVEPVY